MNDDPDDLSLMFGPDDFGSWPPPPLSPAATSSPESSQADDVDGLEVIGSMEHRGVPKSRLIASPDAVALWEHEKSTRSLPDSLQRWEDEGPPHEASNEAYTDAYAFFRRKGYCHLNSHCMGASAPSDLA